MNIHTIGSTTVYRREIEHDVPFSGECAPSRDREKYTVDVMLKEIFGRNVALEHDSNGAPRLVQLDASDTIPLPFVSISHSSREVVIAVDDDVPIGIDIEHWRNSLMKVASRFLTPVQAELYGSSRLLLRAWVMKEAIFKAALPPAGKTLMEMPLPSSTDGGHVTVFGDDIPAVNLDVRVVDESSNTCIALARRLI